MTRDDMGNIVTTWDVQGIQDAQATMDRAHRMLSALCKGEERWHMSIPAQLDRDPDLVLGEALVTGDRAIKEVERLRGWLHVITIEAQMPGYWPNKGTAAWNALNGNPVPS